MNINGKQEENQYFSNLLEMKKLDKNHPDLQKVLNLYISAFPQNELMNFNIFYTDHIRGDVISFYDNNKFIGFAALLTKGNISNILYFAIEPNLRGKGYGTQSLKQICNYFKIFKIILDV